MHLTRASAVKLMTKVQFLYTYKVGAWWVNLVMLACNIGPLCGESTGGHPYKGSVRSSSILHHYSDVTWLLKSPATRLFVQHLDKSDNRENTVLHQWLVISGFPSQRASMQKEFSCQGIIMCTSLCDISKIITQHLLYWFQPCPRKAYLTQTSVMCATDQMGWMLWW